MTDAEYRFREFDGVEVEEDLSEEQASAARLEILDERRQADGLVVSLLWNKLDGTLRVHGVHEETGAEITFPVQPDNFHEAMEDPIAHAARFGLPTEGIYSTVREAA